MITKQVVGKELYVFFNGKLIYKRWIDKGYGMIFEASGGNWIPSERDR